MTTGTDGPEHGTPLPAILFCPACKERHIDRGRFATHPHRDHQCETCGITWRAAKVNTVGVERLYELEAGDPLVEHAERFKPPTDPEWLKVLERERASARLGPELVIANIKQTLGLSPDDAVTMPVANLKKERDELKARVDKLAQAIQAVAGPEPEIRAGTPLEAVPALLAALLAEQRARVDGGARG